MHVPEGWRLIKLGDLLSFKNGINADAGAYGVGTKFVNLLDIFNNKYLHYKDIVGKVNATDKQREDYSVKKGDILFNRTSEIREEIAFSSVYFDEKEAVFGGFVIRGRPEKKWIDKDYSIYAFRHEYFRNQVVRMAQGAVRANIGQKDLSVVNLLLPPIAEQEKIAEILSTWDHAIEQTERLKANAETHKQALMQQLLTGKKRFPEFEGEWEEYKTKQIFKSIVRRAEGGEYEIFSVTKDGIIPQKEYFKKEIASKNTDNYKVIEFGDFVMSGLNFWMGSVDVYLEEYSGMISPAYKVYTIKKGFDISYIKHFVRSFEFNRVLVGSSILGASIVRRNFDSVAFDNWKLKLPSLEEQQKIAAVLNRADREIELLAQKLDHLKTEKRALMQQLLTGKRRVKVDG